MSVLDLINGVKNLEEALKCEVCKHLLTDPLLVARCGHSTCRECFLGDFNMKCPVCQVQVNSKDSLEDKMMKELLAQFRRLKSLVKEDSIGEIEISVTAPQLEIPTSVSKSSNAKSNMSPNDSEMKSPDEAVLDKTSSEENVSPAAANFATSTPVVKRKSKVWPRTRHSRQSSGEDGIVQGTPASSVKPKLMATSTRKKSMSSCKSEENNKSKGGPSPNSSTLNRKNHKGETLLHRSVIKGDLAKVKELIEEGASVNTQDNNGWTPLHEASNHGYVEIAKLLLDNGALVNVPSQKDNITPLHDALINDKMQIAILLASRGADVHAKTALGYTAIDLCKSDEDKVTLVESCSPFIGSSISASNKEKGDLGGNDKCVLLPTGLTDKQKEHLQKCASLLKAEIVDEFVPEVTHVVASCNNNGNCTRTMKVLMGILNGKWIMNFQWIDVCLEYKQKVDEEVFEVQGTKNQPNTQGPKNARKNMAQRFPSLFDGFYFYLHGPFHKPTPEREELCNLIHLGGGKVLSREPREDTVAIENYRLPFHASGTPVEGVSHVILYQDKPPRDHHYRSGHICTSHVMWLIECISEFKLKAFKNDKHGG